MKLQKNLKPKIKYKWQKGAIAITTAPLLVLIIMLCAFALGVSQIYNRKVDLNGFARAVALSAARELNGTAAGVSAARTKARDEALRLRYQYFNDGFAYTWNDAALTFSTDASSSGSWTDGSSPAGLYFAKVDTSALDSEIGNVVPIFGSIFSGSDRPVSLSDVAIAGRKKISVTPIGVCAMSTTAAAPRTNTGASTTELVEYGFRRGVNYDLMQLNPSATSPVSYLINPWISPGVYSSTFDTSLVGPFMCTGNMWMPRLSGGSVRVSPLPTVAPLANIYAQLNVRFDSFNNVLCSPFGGPPDYNVKAYTYSTAGGASWMVPTTGSAAAASTTSRGRLETIADLPSPPVGTLAGSYGPLWSYAKAAKYPSYSAGSAEPAGGYATFSTAEWTYLYKLGPTASNYPVTSPYLAVSGANYRAPASAHLEISAVKRRLLIIPLLSCPIASGNNASATVIGIGKFFMTVPATQSSLIAEFAGTVLEQSITSEVELLP